MAGAEKVKRKLKSYSMICLVMNHLLSLPTERWVYEKGVNKTLSFGTTSQPSLINGNYRYGIGLYAVNYDFCNK